MAYKGDICNEKLARDEKDISPEKVNSFISLLKDIWTDIVAYRDVLRFIGLKESFMQKSRS